MRNLGLCGDLRAEGCGDREAPPIVGRTRRTLTAVAAESRYIWPDLMKRTLLVTVLLFVVSAGAQDVGMGRRAGSGARFEAPYTLTVETPHTAWAKPLRGGPIRLLAVPTVSEGRTLVELAQRLSLDLTTVSIDPSWDINKWTMSFGSDYGARAERGDLDLIYSYLEAELTGPKHFDAILLPVNHGWKRFTAKTREALLRRVKDGAGLVLIRPMDAEISPLRPLTVGEPEGDNAIVEPGQPERGAWTKGENHYITHSIPVASFPFDYIENYRYAATPDAQVLAVNQSGTPVIAVRKQGKGRVVAFGYRNAGISWQIPQTAKGFVAPEQWEAFYALLVRSLIYAAGREADAPGEWSVPAAPARTHLIRDLAVSKTPIAEGDRIEVTWTGTGQAKVELVDAFDRVLARAEGNGRASLTVSRPLTHSGFVNAGDAKLPVTFATSNRKWEDYEVIMPWYGPPSLQPWTPALDDQFRRIGITTLSSAQRNFRMIASAGLHDVFGIYAYRNDAYAKRKALYAETKDKKYLTRNVILQAPDFDSNLREELGKRLGKIAPLHPLAYYLADESSLTTYTDAFDVGWSPNALAGFRIWLQHEYPSLSALNTSWGTTFPNWGDVFPMTTEEAQRHGNFAPWSDHRVYMEQEFVKALRTAREMVREIDPGAPASISGTQIPTAHNGANWYEIDQIMDYLQPYSGGNQNPMHYLFRPGILLTGFTGYGLTGPALHHEQWERLFYGHTGASIFWHYTILNPDLTLSEQGKDLAEAFGKIQSGIGRVFMNSKVREDGVAIHFSMASIRGAWIQDGKILPTIANVNRTSKNYVDLVKRRDEWVKALERQGIQFRFLATPQIESGELEKYKVLILPYSIALSDAEARAIERFVDRGGTVYADEQTGRMDERCHWRTTPLFAGEHKGILRQAPGPINVKPAFPLPGRYLTTVREFGESRLIGALPAEPASVDLPASRAIRYDLLRGGLAGHKIDVSPANPLLLIERSSRISKLEITPELAVVLGDENGEPVDLSVVHAEVFDPAGKLIRPYCGNYTIREGTARIEIPFALNDSSGTWRVRVRDVISGLTAERRIRR